MQDHGQILKSLEMIACELDAYYRSVVDLKSSLPRCSYCYSHTQRSPDWTGNSPMCLYEDVDGALKTL